MTRHMERRMECALVRRIVRERLRSRRIFKNDFGSGERTRIKHFCYQMLYALKNLDVQSYYTHNRPSKTSPQLLLERMENVPNIRFDFRRDLSPMRLTAGGFRGALSLHLRTKHSFRTYHIRSVLFAFFFVNSLSQKSNRFIEQVSVVIFKKSSPALHTPDPGWSPCSPRKVVNAIARCCVRRSTSNIGGLLSMLSCFNCTIMLLRELSQRSSTWTNTEGICFRSQN